MTCSLELTTIASRKSLAPGFNLWTIRKQRYCFKEGLLSLTFKLDTHMGCYGFPYRKKQGVQKARNVFFFFFVYRCLRESLYL